ncbi:MAG: hypothetical protein WC819_03445 [Parcubacteria group bacterium]|jgi:H+/Cl- antiporter ClcA
MRIIADRVVQFVAPGEPTVTKKIVYLIAATILGALVGIVACALVEFSQLNSPGGDHIGPIFYWVLLLLGAVGGFLSGRVWWRKIYVEKVWARRKLL